MHICIHVTIGWDWAPLTTFQITNYTSPFLCVLSFSRKLFTLFSPPSLVCQRRIYPCAPFQPWDSVRSDAGSLTLGRLNALEAERKLLDVLPWIHNCQHRISAFHSPPQTYITIIHLSVSIQIKLWLLYVSDWLYMFMNTYYMLAHKKQHKLSYRR